MWPPPMMRGSTVTLPDIGCVKSIGRSNAPLWDWTPVRVNAPTDVAVSARHTVRLFAVKRRNPCSAESFATGRLDNRICSLLYFAHTFNHGVAHMSATMSFKPSVTNLRLVAILVVARLRTFCATMYAMHRQQNRVHFAIGSLRHPTQPCAQGRAPQSHPARRPKIRRFGAPTNAHTSHHA